MNSFMLEKNLNALALFNPELAKELKNHKVDENVCTIVSAEKGGVNNLIMTKENLYYYEAKNILNSVNKELETHTFQNPKLTVVLGFGLGYHLGEFLKNLVRPGMVRKILVVEKELSILKLGLSVTDISHLLSNGTLNIIGGVAKEHLYNNIYHYCMEKKDVKLFAKSIAVLPVNAAMALDKEYYLLSMKFLRESFNQTLVNFGNSPEDSLLGLENMLLNIDYTLQYPGIIHLFDKFVAKPAILVAAGPSLEKNVELLRGLEDKAFIIAVDTALRILLKRGIYPHAVTSIERGISTLNYYTNLEEYQPKLSKIYFMPATIVRRELYETCVDKYGMKPIIVYRDFAHYKWLEVDKGTIFSGKSCANLAFKMLTTMGFEKIVLLGQDLAFGEFGQTHISGADHSINGMKASPKIKEEMVVKGNFVPEIKTIRTWYNFLRYYEKDIAEYSGEVINATEGGAWIEGTHLMSFKDAISKNLVNSWNVSGFIEKNLALFDKKQAGEDAAKVKNIMMETEAFLQTTIAKCRKGVDSIELFKSELAEITCGKELPFTDTPADFLQKWGEELYRLKKEIVDAPLFYLFMMHIAQSYIIKTEITINSLSGLYQHENEINAAYIKLLAEWFPAIGSMTEIAAGYLDKSMKTLGA